METLATVACEGKDQGTALVGVIVTVVVMVGVAVASSGPATREVGSRVGSCTAGDVGEFSTVGVGPTVREGSGVQVGHSVGVTTAVGGCKATIIRLSIMLNAIKPLRIKMMVWLKLRFGLFRLRLLTRTYLLEKTTVPL